jgi:hypothetical protein
VARLSASVIPLPRQAPTGHCNSGNRDNRLSVRSSLIPALTDANHMLRKSSERIDLLTIQQRSSFLFPGLHSSHQMFQQKQLQKRNEMKIQ